MQTGLILRSYGINWGLPKNYSYKHGIGNFSTSYSLEKHKNDDISVDSARNLIVLLAENFLKEINANLEVQPILDVYPFINDLLDISIYFEDEDRVQLGQGVAVIYFIEGKIKYEGYHIGGYRKPGHAYGKHYTIHKESYAEALDIVKKQGNLKYL